MNTEMSLQRKKRFLRAFKINKRQLQLQSFVWPGLIFMLIFMYIPMGGIIIAFKDYNVVKGFLASPWIGLEYFKEFLTDARFYKVLRNSLGINILQLVFAFPIPIIFALLLNEIKNTYFKPIVQTVSYLPHFVSWVIYGGLVYVMLDPSKVVNSLLLYMHIIDKPILFLGKPEYFWPIAVFAGVAKNFGWGSIIYLAAIAGVDPELYNAATVDGAGRFQKMWHITLPSIKGTIVILLIFNVSKILNTGFDQIWILYNSLNADMSETIEVYVYKMGLENFRFSYATAVGLMKSVVSLILLSSANYISKKTSDHGIY